MAEKVKKDTGMLEGTVVSYRMDNPHEAKAAIAAMKEWAVSFPDELPGDWPDDAIRRLNADRCRSILATVGIADDEMVAVNLSPFREKGLAENSAQWLAAHWLAQYNNLMRARARFEAGDVTPNNIAGMLLATEEMGVLQERMWWRAGVDPETGTKRETLAMERKKSRLAFKNNPDRNHERKANAAAWLDVAQKLASAYWHRKPLASKSEVAKEVLRIWPQGADSPNAPSFSSVRQKIVQPPNS